MAEEKKADAKAPKAELTPEEAAATSKKKKLIIIIAAAVVGLGGVGGALAVILGGGEKKAKPAAEGEEHGEKKEGEHAEKKEGEGEKKEEHGEKKEGEHAEKKEGEGEKKEEHGEKKEGEHGEKKEGEHGEKKEGEGGKKDAKKDAKLDGVDFGCTIPLKPFHLNLGNPLENRYVRLEIALEYGCADEAKAEIEKRMPQLQDAIITVTSRKTREFLLGPDGKEQLRKEILNRVNHYMTAKIDDVFITDLLIE